jgi:hypothetical protein
VFTVAHSALYAMLQIDPALYTYTSAKLLPFKAATHSPAPGRVVCYFFVAPLLPLLVLLLLFLRCFFIALFVFLLLYLCFFVTLLCLYAVGFVCLCINAFVKVLTFSF